MAWNEEVIGAVWEKGKPTSDSANWRKDQCDAWIKRDQYGKRQSAYGWEIDHIKAVANGGGNQLSNLRPLHCENNCRKLDGKLVTFVTSDGNKNIRVKEKD